MDQERPDGAEYFDEAPGEPGSPAAGASGGAGTAAWTREGRWALLAAILSLWAIALLWLVANNAPSSGGEPPNLVSITARAPTPTAVAPPQPSTFAEPMIVGGVGAGES